MMTAEDATPVGKRLEPAGIRVFISSTFRDMQFERDILVRRVFPAFRRRAELRGISISEIDLRWGITEQQAREGRVLALCLREIDLCRPFFIALLGQRYGWQSADTRTHLGYVRPDLVNFSERSLTELEIRHAVLNPPPGAPESEALFLFRDPQLSEEQRLARGDQRDAYYSDTEQMRSVDSLASEIRDKFSGRVEGYASFSSFEERTAAFLDRILETQIALVNSSQHLVDPHRGLLAVRVAHHVRRRFLEPLFSLRSFGANAVALVGAAGTGKSDMLTTLLVAQEAGGARLLYRDCEAGGGFSGWRHLLAGLVSELTDQSDAAEGEQQGDIESSMVAKLRCRTNGRSIVIGLDNLDGLFEGDEDIDISWLQRLQIPRVRLLVSARSEALRAMLRAEGWRMLTCGSLSRDDRQRIAVALLEQHGKRLAPRPLSNLVRSPASYNARFLTTALQYLRERSLFETIDKDLVDVAATRDLKSLVTLVVANARTGEPPGWTGLTQRALALLAASRRGLTDQEIRTCSETTTGPLPPLYWSALNAALGPLLASRDGFWDFASGISPILASAGLISDNAMTAARRTLANHFNGAPAKRRLDEYPWQLLQLRDWIALQRELSDAATLDSMWRRSPDEVRYYFGRLLHAGIAERVDELLPTDDAVTSLHAGVAAKLHLLSDFGMGARATALATRLKNSQDIAAPVRWVAYMLLIAQALEESAGQDALRLLVDLRSADLIVTPRDRDRALLAEAAALQLAGHAEQAFATTEQVVAAAEQRGDDDLLATAVGNLGGLWASVGDYRSATAHYRRQLALSRRSAIPTGVCQSLMGLARSAQAQGRMRRTLDNLGQAKRYALRYSAKRDYADILDLSGRLHLTYDNFDAAQRDLEEEESVGRELAAPSIQARALIAQCELYLRIGRPTAANECAHRALGPAAASGRPDLENAANKILQITKSQ
jgi:hypothetical protein